MPGSLSNHDGGSIGQGHLPDNGRPARVKEAVADKRRGRHGQRVDGDGVREHDRWRHRDPFCARLGWEHYR